MLEGKSTTRQVNLCQNFVFACAPTFFLKVITWFVPCLRSNEKTVPCQLKQPQWALTLNTCYGHVILVSGYLVLTAFINHSMDEHSQRCTYVNYVILLTFKVLGLVHGKSYDNQFVFRLTGCKFCKGMGLDPLTHWPQELCYVIHSLLLRNCYWITFNYYFLFQISFYWTSASIWTDGRSSTLPRFFADASV